MSMVNKPQHMTLLFQRITVDILICKYWVQKWPLHIDLSRRSLCVARAFTEVGFCYL